MRLLDTKNFRYPLRALALIAIAFAGTLAFTTTAQAASALTAAKYSLKSSASRGEIRQAEKGNCERGGSSGAFRFKIGKKTKECSYRVPMVGKNLEMSATARLFKSTPKQVRPQAFVAVNLRQASDGSRYQLSVFPSGRRFQLKKIYPNGKIQVLKAGKGIKGINTFNQKNRILLRAFNGVSGGSGTARLLAVVNGNKLAVVDDERGNELQGQHSTFSIGSKKNATGALGSFVGVKMRLPDPF
ncbi:MAG: hypothetical protein WBP55_01530 [Solirubrobacterales bacterium]